MKISEYNVELEGASLNYQKTKVSYSSVTKKLPVYEISVSSPKKELELSEKDKMKIRIIQMMLEKLFGKKLKIQFVEDPDEENEENVRLKNAGERIIEEYTLEFESTHLQYASFKGSGIVKTQDGRAINFSVEFKELSLTYSYVKTSGTYSDPLIFSQLKNSQSKGKILEIDINLDGVKDKFYLSPGEGLLVLDKNGNGKVDDGSELFGPTTGDGFKELAMYDKDGNEWIDENDLIFTKLKVWTINERGEEKLVGLLDFNVGAIFLGRVSTPFDYGDKKMLSSGIYLGEDGTVGTIRQFDIRV